MRRFYLQRNEDISGVSGLGKVAEGCQFDNGWCALTWLTNEKPEDVVVSWYCNVRRVEEVHGHGGATQVVFVDHGSSNVVIRNEHTDSPLYCVHANEVPQECPCLPDCYCKGHTCS